MNYERLLTYGHCIPLDILINPIKLIEEISSYSFSQYNPKKAKKFSNPRYGLSVTSLNGEMNGIDLNSLKELSNIDLAELDFKTKTPVWYSSKETQKALCHFDQFLGRTHFLNLKEGGYFPPHRDIDSKSNQDSLRIIIPIRECNPPYSYFVHGNDILYWEHGRAYFLNTNMTHSIISYTQNNLMLVANIESCSESHKKIIDFASNC